MDAVNARIKSLQLDDRVPEQWAVQPPPRPIAMSTVLTHMPQPSSQSSGLMQAAATSAGQKVRQIKSFATQTVRRSSRRPAGRSGETRTQQILKLSLAGHAKRSGQQKGPRPDNRRQLALRGSRATIGITMKVLVPRLAALRRLSTAKLVPELVQLYANPPTRAYAHYAVQRQELFYVSGQANNCFLRSFCVSLLGFIISDEQAAMLRSLIEAVLNCVIALDPADALLIFPTTLGTPHNAKAQLRNANASNAMLETATIYALTLVFPEIVVRVDETPVPSEGKAPASVVGLRALIRSPALSAIFPEAEKDEQPSVPVGALLANTYLYAHHYYGVVDMPEGGFRSLNDDSLLRQPQLSAPEFFSCVQNFINDKELIDSMLRAQRDVVRAANCVFVDSCDSNPYQRSVDIVYAVKIAESALPQLRNVIASFSRDSTVAPETQHSLPARTTANSKQAAGNPRLLAPANTYCSAAVAKAPAVVPSTSASGAVTAVPTSTVAVVPRCTDTDVPCVPVATGPAVNCHICGGVETKDQPMLASKCHSADCKNFWHPRCYEPLDTADPSLCRDCVNKNRAAVGLPVRPIAKKKSKQRATGKRTQPAAKLKKSHVHIGQPPAAPTASRVDAPSVPSSDPASPCVSLSPGADASTALAASVATCAPQAQQPATDALVSDSVARDCSGGAIADQNNPLQSSCDDIPLDYGDPSFSESAEVEAEAEASTAQNSERSLRNAAPADPCSVRAATPAATAAVPVTTAAPQALAAAATPPGTGVAATATAVSGIAVVAAPAPHERSSAHLLAPTQIAEFPVSHHTRSKTMKLSSAKSLVTTSANPRNRSGPTTNVAGATAAATAISAPSNPSTAAAVSNSSSSASPPAAAATSTSHPDARRGTLQPDSARSSAADASSDIPANAASSRARRRRGTRDGAS